MDSRDVKNIKGIDISNWQGENDFAKVKAQGIEVVYMKASEGATYKDKYLVQNYQGCKAQGLKIGFYHFLRGTSDAVVQAKHFYDCIEGMDYDCKLAIDIEVTDGLSSQDLSNKVVAFADEIKRLSGNDVVVYTYTSFAQNNLTKDLAKYPLWVAHYGVNTPSDNPIWSNWIGFQYTDKAIIDGVGDKVDADEFKDAIYLKQIEHHGDTMWVEANDIKVGEIVKIVGNNYATGENIPTEYKGKGYHVQQVDGSKILIQELMSWVNMGDVLVARVSGILPTGVIDQRAFVNTKALNVRCGMGTTFDKVGSLPQGTMINAWYCENGWVSFGYNNKIAYVYSPYLDI